MDECFDIIMVRLEKQVSGTTLGVIGYGDIGRAAAVKAKAMGMNVIAQRRRPELSQGDGIADQVLGAGQVKEDENKCGGSDVLFSSRNTSSSDLLGGKVCEWRAGRGRHKTSLLTHY